VIGVLVVVFLVEVGLLIAEATLGVVVGFMIEEEALVGVAVAVVFSPSSQSSSFEPSSSPSQSSSSPPPVADAALVDVVDVAGVHSLGRLESD